MKMTLLAVVAVAVVAAFTYHSIAEDAQVKPEGPANVLEFTMKDIDGKDVPLSQYRNEVNLIVNVASKCGLTPQYEQLSAVYDKYHEKGFNVLGFPANNFMGQEPGTNDEIKLFCKEKYDVKFPMFSKISVKGEDQDPLYAFLTKQETAPEKPGDISWNFEKFLVNRQGKVVARFGPKTKPDDPEVIKAIEAALEQK